MDEQKIRPLTAQELQANVSAFLDLRPDGYALHHKSKRLSILEFNRAVDSSEDWGRKEGCRKKELTRTHSGVLQLPAGEGGLDHDPV